MAKPERRELDPPDPSGTSSATRRRVRLLGRSDRWRAWTPYLVLAMGLVVTMAATTMVHRQVTEDDRVRFEASNHLLVEVMRARFEEYGDILRAMVGLYRVLGEVPPGEFQTFAESQGLGGHPGLVAVSYVEVIAEADVQERERAARREGLEGFRVWPPGGSSRHVVVTRVYPFEPHRGALGFDLTTSATRREALRSACRTGMPTITDPVELASDPGSGSPFGMLVVLPVYAPGAEATCDGVRGYVSAVLSLEAFFETADDVLPERRIEFAAYSGEPGPGNLLYQTSLSAPDDALRFAGSRSMDLGGRAWELRFWPGPGFDDLSPRSLVPFALLAGVVISLALFGLVWSESRARAHAQTVANELARSEHALTRSNRAKDEFLAMLGHELRNPLSAVKIALGILRDADITDPDARAALDVAERQLRHQNRLVDDLLDVSRVSRGKIALSPKRVDLRDIVSHAVAGMQGAAEASEHGISVDRAAEEIPVHVDPTRIEQVVTNLLSNAVKYSPGGSRVRVTVEAEGGEAVVRVRDQGVGLEPDALERIFDLFAQEHTSLDRSAGGLGIGLTLVKRLIELHGGRVLAHSEGMGTGTEFEVRLPLASGTAPPSTESVAARPATELRILVVEDNDDARTMLRALLEKQGHRVETASDGEAGVQAAQEATPDVALVDIGLPRMDGYEVARILRERWGKDIVLIAVTGYGQPTDVRRSGEAGFDHHLIKPVDSDRLAALLAEIRPRPSMASATG